MNKSTGDSCQVFGTIIGLFLTDKAKNSLSHGMFKAIRVLVWGCVTSASPVAAPFLLETLSEFSFLVPPSLFLFHMVPVELKAASGWGAGYAPQLCDRSGWAGAPGGARAKEWEPRDYKCCGERSVPSTRVAKLFKSVPGVTMGPA